SQLVAAEIFTSTGNGIQAWNGSSWNILGGGCNNTVLDLGVHAGSLYVFGRFDQVNSGSPLTVNHIAAWNGTSWSGPGAGLPFPPSNFTSCGLASFNGSLLVSALNRDPADTPVYGGLARWDGATWSTYAGGLGWQRTGYSIDGPVNSFAKYGGELIAGGAFHN